MRLPADATLIVIHPGEASGSSDPAGPSANLVRLLDAWRAEELPVAHVRMSAADVVEPAQHELLVAAAAASAFASTSLEASLDEIGATTLVLCGASRPVEATARDADRLGYQTFIVSDACGGSGESGEPAFAHLHGKCATVVDVEAALRAAAVARARQRRSAMRRE
jgi:nicotinamidase-related amidase